MILSELSHILLYMENGFLKEKYDLHNSPEVESAAERTEIRTDEKVPQNPADRIQNYLDRFTEILERKDPDKREHGIEALKRLIYSKFVITPEEIPEGYFENQRRLAREQGHGDIEVTRDMREQLAEVIVADQRSSLDTWVDYLSSSDATYPDWLKYYAMRSILGMGEYDKERGAFTKRSTGTTKPFPDLNREALAYVLDAIEKKYKGEKVNFAALEQEDKVKFEKLLQGENFAKLYAWAIDKTAPSEKNLLTITEGKWVKYPQGAEHMPLVESLQGHGTGWCTAGESTAEAQLRGGDFYVYYSLDQEGNPTVPRAAIRMQGDGIGEVRGIADQQNLDPYISEVVQAKLKDFPDGKAYEKKAHDMKVLTGIERKVQKGEQLDKDDLILLYEINAPIEGFGYQKDPRIEELRAKRDPIEDMPIVFECSEDQIVTKVEDINAETKAYVGQLQPGIFDVLEQYNVEHIYTSFPEGKIRRENIEIGGKDKKELERELKDRGIQVSNYAKSMMDNKDFANLKKAEQAKLIRLTVKDLGFSNYATTDDLYKRAEDLGLELCPAEVGPHYRLQYKDQPMHEWLYIGMKQIAGSGGYPGVFGVGRDDGGLWLGYGIARPAHEWDPGVELVFRLRKKNLES